MRGKVVAVEERDHHLGITPAYAGKRRQTGNQNHDAEDHPRVCGEKCFAISAALSEMGSPPRMRGKVCIPLWCSVTAGITPAYAGKRDKPLVIVSTITDHPRVCGEKALSTFSSLKNSGSPPRMRGKVQNQEALSAGNGITPAYAGKRKSCVVQKINAWDHPRVCGEKMPCSPWGMILVGSPPRMRGKD